MNTKTQKNTKNKEVRALIKQSGFAHWEIAEALGFSSTTYFCRIFKKYAKISPLKYRNSQSK